jgi:hypothetical protein
MNDPQTLQEFYKISISIAGVFFPVFQALIYFIVEKSFNKFEFSRQELVGFYQKRGVIISIALIYLILQPIFKLLSLGLFSNILFSLYLILIAIFRLRLLESTGIWETMNSTKFIPAKANSFMKFLIACLNNWILEKIKFIFFICFLIIFSIFSEDKIFISVLSTLVYVLISTTFLLNDPLSIQKELLRHEWTGEDLVREKWTSEKMQQEKNLIIQQMQGQYLFATNKKDTSGMFEFSTYPEVRENGELFSVINLSDLDLKDINDFKNRILLISQEFLIHLSNSKTDINSFVLSYNFDIDGIHRNIFIRTDKNEIKKYKMLSPNHFFQNLRNTLIDDILK